MKIDEHTQSNLDLEAQQFLMVLIKCGGSQINKKGLLVTKGLSVLCTSFLSGLCSLMSLRFTEAPSAVTPIT